MTKTRISRCALPEADFDRTCKESTLIGSWYTSSILQGLLRHEVSWISRLADNGLFGIAALLGVRGCEGRARWKGPPLAAHGALLQIT